MPPIYVCFHSLCVQGDFNYRGPFQFYTSNGVCDDGENGLPGYVGHADPFPSLTQKCTSPQRNGLSAGSSGYYLYSDDCVTANGTIITKPWSRWEG